MKPEPTLSPLSQTNELYRPLDFVNAPTLDDDRKKWEERKKILDKAKEDGII
jgi:hypothetical protein